MGLEPTRTYCPTDFLATLAYTSRLKSPHGLVNTALFHPAKFLCPFL